jgi:hypothetical protein
MRNLQQSHARQRALLETTHAYDASLRSFHSVPPRTVHTLYDHLSEMRAENSSFS